MGGLNVSKRNGGAEERGVCVKNKGDSFVCSSKGHNKVVIVREKNEGESQRSGNWEWGGSFE
jgi:hypothetical protein